MLIPDSKRQFTKPETPEAVFLNPRAHPSLTVDEESVSLPRGGIALRYADNFGRVDSLPFGNESTKSGISCSIDPIER
jgi:hypothetical protein